jgi:hypothetical protein
MIEIEGSLSELKKTVSAWPLLTIEGLEPYQGLIVQHLEEMLSWMKELCHNDEVKTDSVYSGENNNKNVEDVGENEVRT